MTVENVEIRAISRALSDAWKSFTESTEENFEERKKHFLDLRASIDSLDPDVRKEILKRVRG